jgi:Flp pilus assembly protein TadG
LRRLEKDEGGSVIVLVSILLVMLLGMGALVVDAGLLFESRRALVTTADSAALAGATEFAQVLLNGGSVEDAADAAETRARQYALMNGTAAEDVTVIVDQVNYTVTVEVIRTNNLAFASVFGVPSSPTGARAVAATGPVHSMGGGTMPIYVSPAAHDYAGETLNLREGTPPPRDPGNFTALALGGPGANTYLFNLVNGYPGTISKGDLVETQTGNIPNKTVEGIQSRIDACQDHCQRPPGMSECTAANHASDCPRVVTLLVCDFQDLHGHQSIRVDGFLTFFLDEVHKQGGSVVINGFVKNDIRSGKIRGASGELGSDYGTWAVNLIQ